MPAVFICLGGKPPKATKRFACPSARLRTADLHGYLPKPGQLISLSESAWAPDRVILVDAGYEISPLHFGKGGRPALVLGYVENKAGKTLVEVLLLATFGFGPADAYNKDLIHPALRDYVAHARDADGWHWPADSVPIYNMNCAKNWVILLPLAVEFDSRRPLERWQGVSPACPPSVSDETLECLRKCAYENYYEVLSRVYQSRAEALRLVKAMYDATLPPGTAHPKTQCPPPGFRLPLEQMQRTEPMQPVDLNSKKRHAPYASSKRKKPAGAREPVLPFWQQVMQLRAEIHHWTSVPGAP
ncbi:uncharacterized protein SCHCODRAFT_02518166 [Schizophyllum commune H4-8]|uniref:Uncharacterized protein n=1 Tax=Schizophyllum commune (strain H4-8 / FGSC 9210) TaxID=578458 RepID=D8QJG0_SCHCM|nr:uncharacterized protein SCHCODRAFT_02518166 [Schizophyllum commune H4-8]KAI5886346.1 hypothetical protein SCHCODRAFT_02518166 [Schizophyllum commune H4-8]